MLKLNFADKILAGVNQSYTFTSDEGPPAGKVLIDGSEVDHRVVPLGPPKEAVTGTRLMKYKVAFFIPGEALGKKLQMRFEAGSSSVDEDKEIIAG